MKKTIQKMILPSRRKLVLPVLGLIISLSAAAQSHQGISPVADRKEIIVGEATDEIEVRGDVTVVLTNAQAGDILLEGNSKDVASVKTSVKNGRLLIDAEKRYTFSKLTVYLSVTNISSLIINGNTEIFSAGNIRTNELEITVNGDSMVEVYHRGNLKVTPAEGYKVVDNPANTRRKMLR